MARYPTMQNGVKREVGGSAVYAFAVTTSDSTLFSYPTSALFVGGAGNLTVTMASGDDAVFTGVVAGTILPVQVVKVKAATTATNITALV